MTRLILALALFVTASVFTMAQSTTLETLNEPHSGTPFPVSLTPPGDTTPHWIMGAGLRQRTILRLRIYAFGLYIDPEGARASLSQFAGLPTSTLERDESFYRHLLDLNFAMTLRLVMTRTVSGADVAASFNDALRPRMTRTVMDTNNSSDLTALKEFRGYLDVDEVRTGTELIFSCSPAGRLTTSVGGDERPPITSKSLCRALFDVYLGEDPISDAGKRSIIAGFHGLLD
jgi:hypothetical protein